MAETGGLDRRKFLIGGSAAAGLVLAWAIWPRVYKPSLVAAEGERVFNAYLKIASSGQVTVAVPQSEMGQGAFTVLPQILADELGADWRAVAVEPAPLNPLYTNVALAEQWAEALLPADAGQALDSGPARWAVEEFATRSAFVVTADSTMLSAYAQPFREAGAAARALLAQAAARAGKLSPGVTPCRRSVGFPCHMAVSLLSFHAGSVFWGES